MTIPKLKRVKVSSTQDLRNWLSKAADRSEQVMILTCNKASGDKYISRDQLLETLSETAWTAGRSYTLQGNLVGHVVQHSGTDAAR